MKVIKVLVALLATVSFCVLLAQSDAEYMGWMKSAVASKGKVAKGIAAKDGPTVATEAKSMEESFAHIEDYWTKKGAEDASGFAKQAVAASADIAKAGSEGDFAAANTAMMALGGTCGGCHMAHRAKGASGFEIK